MLRLEGLRHTRESVAKRRLIHRQGMPFACAAWETESNALADLDVFAETRIEAATTGDSVDVTYRFRELPPYVPYVSVAKTDQDGFSAGPAVAALNLFGTGAHLEAASRFGGTTEFYGSLAGLEVAAWPLEYDLLLSHVDSYNGGLDFHENSWRFKFDAKQPWRCGTALGPWFTVGGYEFLNLSSDRDGITWNGRANRAESQHRLALGLAYDGRNRRRLPDRGVYLEVRVQRSASEVTTMWTDAGATGAGLQSTEFLFDMRAYHPLTQRQGVAFSLLHRVRSGEVPRYDLYRAGGANSLRGYAHGAALGRSESVIFLEDRLTLLPRRSYKLGPWGIPVGVQAVLGLEWLRSWSAGSFVDAEGEAVNKAAIYVGVHVLTGGLDRLRFEGGSNTASLAEGFEPRADIGFFDKADAQRFRTR